MENSLKPVIISPYNSAWPDQFDRLKMVYEEHLGNLALEIVHVGSTAVPGLCAKPVIDIDLVIADVSMLELIIPKLCALGYEYLGIVAIPDRYVFRPLSGPVPEDGSGQIWPKHHLYCCLQGSAALRNHLLLRDALRADPELRDAYGKLKMELASRGLSMDAYVMEKTGFITAVLSGAGMPAAELAAITEQNKTVIARK